MALVTRTQESCRLANFHADDLAYNTFYFADVLAGLMDGDAVGGGSQSGKQQNAKERYQAPRSGQQQTSRCLALPGRAHEYVRPLDHHKSHRIG